MTDKVLVTGADGFIGSHLTEALVRSGASVRAFTYYNSLGRNGWLDHVDPQVRRSIEIVSGDVRDFERVKQAVSGCRTVYHLAALIGIPYSYVAARSYIDTNVSGTLNVLQASLESGVERVIHTSTSEVYGSAQFVPISEEHPLQAQSPYAASKIGADQLALSFMRSHRLPVAVVRPFNTFGPRQSNRAVIPTIITQIARGERVIRLGALKPTRDFNFVDTTVSGFMAAAQCDGLLGDVMNLGSGFEISIGEVAHEIAAVMNASVTIEQDEARIRPEASEVERLCADTRKATRLINWQPPQNQRKSLVEGLRITAEWFQRTDVLSLYGSEYAI
jgi:dTDP-glucose 4,6-dehydratase